MDADIAVRATNVSKIYDLRNKDNQHRTDSSRFYARYLANFFKKPEHFFWF